MNKKLKLFIIILLILILFLAGYLITTKFKIFSKKATSLQKTPGLSVVPTMNDTITADSSWCGTFQLVWNDLKNEVVKKDIVFTPQLEMADNLNKEDFTEDMLSDEYYFKIYGLKSLDLKNKIESGIKEKFNQTSGILEGFDWSPNALDNSNNENIKRYLFYAMLYREFEFLEEFDKLENQNFGNKYNDVQYFGIDNTTNNSVGNQIDVLYYNSRDDFAIIVNTKSNDEVIFCKNPQGTTFKEIFDNMNANASKYDGNTKFQNIDEFKAPNLTFNEKKEYSELQNNPFKATNDDTIIIEKALQTIEFSLNEKGGKIKSEAAIGAIAGTTSLDDTMKRPTPRYFYVDDTFAIFLREKGQTIPYFAGRIDDITKFQN